MELDTQKRARAGGEFGPNGEWYDGGTFIATTDVLKSSPAERQAVDPAWRAEHRARVDRLREWLTARQAALADIIARLTANPGIVDAVRWAWMLENGHAGFLPGLGRQLATSGSLSPRQAQFVARELLGRQGRRNAEAWDAMMALLTEQFQD